MYGVLVKVRTLNDLDIILEEIPRRFLESLRDMTLSMLEVVRDSLTHLQAAKCGEGFVVTFESYSLGKS